MTYVTNAKYIETLSAETIERKLNRPKTTEFSLPRRYGGGFSWWKALGAMLRHPRTFFSAGFSAGLMAADPASNVIIDKPYADRWASTLGEYADWYFRDKAFSHSIHWMGVPCRKMIFDIWVYQEIIFETKPDVIIEIGSFHGGSALFLGQVCDAVGHGEIITIDISHEFFRGQHPRVTAITNDCSDPALLEKLRAQFVGKSVMVIHDGDHQSAAVARDLKLYAPLVTPGQYLIIEDGIVDLFDPAKNKMRKGYAQGGPLGPARAFAKEHADTFELDMTRERFILTSNPQGYLKRKGN